MDKFNSFSWRLSFSSRIFIFIVTFTGATAASADNILIGIHGLANKPSEEQLSEWWIKSLNEKGVCDVDSSALKLVYWADTRYPEPIANDENKEPYLPGIKDAGEERKKAVPVVTLRHALTEMSGKFIEATGGDGGTITEKVMNRFVSDLGDYYREDIKIEHGEDTGKKYRETIRGRLQQALEDHMDDQILLIAHSMASIIAYDTLLDLEEEGSGLKVDHLITIGSPLGLATVKKKIKAERENLGRKLSNPKAPATIKKSWLNQTDATDPVGLDTKITNDYKNETDITFKDQIVVNDYGFKNEDNELEFNSHKIYGYLRTPEILEVVCKFLSR